MQTPAPGSENTAEQTERLRRFRAGVHACLTGWADAAFELTDALLCAPGPVSSVPTLSLEPVFRRSHGSLYKALARGGVDAEQMRDLLATHRPRDWPLVFAVDASTWARCDAEPSPERGYYYSASEHSAGKPIVAGWSYQWITQLGWANDSWTAPMDARRIAPTENTTQVTTAQVRALVARLGQDEGEPEPMFVFDAGYDPIALTHELAEVPATIVVRIRETRVFRTDPTPPAPGTSTRHPRPAPPARPGGQAQRPEHPAGPRPRVGRHRPAVRHRHGHRLAQVAPRTRPARPLGRVRGATHRQRHRHPRRRAAPAQADVPDQEDPVALGRRHRCRPRYRLAGLSTPLRYRTHLQVRQEHPRLGHTLGVHPRAGRPVDLARGRRLHPAAPGQNAGPGRPPAVGTTTETRPAHPGPGPARISSTRPNPGHPGQSTKRLEPRPWTPQRHPPKATHPPSRDQKGRIAGFNRLF